MDIILSSIAFLLLLFMAVKTLKSRPSYKNSILRLPPGPNPLPIIGNIHQLFGSPMHHMFRDLAKKYGPLMYLKLGETPTIIVSSPEMAKEIYKTNDIIFASRPSYHLTVKILSYNYTDILFSPYGNYWRQLRKICTMEVLSPKRVQTFKGIREGEVLNLLKSISSQKGSNSSINLSRMLFSLSYSITGRAALGKKSKDTERFLEVINEMNGASSEFCLANMFPSVKLFQVMSTLRLKCEKIHRKADEILENILIEHKEKNDTYTKQEGLKEDLVDVLLRVQKDGDFQPQLTDANIKAAILDIFSAGSETSSTTIEWAISEMIKSPQTMKRAQDEVRNVYNNEGSVDESRLHELKYLRAVIKETLRLHPGVPLLLPRECGQDCKIDGYDIPAKTQIIVNAWAIGRDPKYWTESEEFNPSRFLDSEIDYKGNNFEYIPFGAGRRICPGISFSQAVIEMVLAQLLFHYDWKLPRQMKPEDLDMTENLGVTVRRKKDLHLIPIPYFNSCLVKDN